MLEKSLQGEFDVLRTFSTTEVFASEEHLGDYQTQRFEGFAPYVHEEALSYGGAGSKCGKIRGANGKTKLSHAQTHGSRTDDDDLDPFLAQVAYGFSKNPKSISLYCPGSRGQNTGSQLYDKTGNFSYGWFLRVGRHLTFVAGFRLRISLGSSFRYCFLVNVLSEKLSLRKISCLKRKGYPAVRVA
jgi:hypothetical protein